MPGQQGTVSPAVEDWGSAPVDALVDLLEATTRRLQTALETLAIERAHYWRSYWAHWQRLTPAESVAAKNRACELECANRNEHVIIGEGVVESLRAKRDGLVAAIGARQ